ncbi:ribonuclease H family protein [Flavobacterium silvaticum]|uniref:ribonuclease H family protein n=1 Tax=Flavobacterium silvaticum TaxID=1852020 RepID=UPI00293BD8FB|nr:ribonuclease H family protein [Flavobacterium silvaticum]
MTKQKYYVVWVGRETGVFETWENCQLQIKGFPKAVYKSFKSKHEAEKAFANSSENYIGKTLDLIEISDEEKQLIGQPVLESISVDGAWNTQTGVVEYQGVDTKSKIQIFKQGPFEDGTINIVEFLGIVHALAYCKQKNIICPIYSR